MRIIISFLLYVCLINLPVKAQEILKGNRKGISDGLSQNSVLSIIQDDQGFIWLGTQDGLNKFDGYQFTHFKESIQDSSKLNNDYILTLHQTKDNNIWVGTLGGGLNCYNPITNSFTRKNIGIGKGGEISTIIESKAGMLWIGTRDHGLICFNPSTNSYELFSVNQAIHTLMLEGDEHLWIGTDNGIEILDIKAKTFAKPNASNCLASKSVNSITKDVSDTKWFGSKSGLYFLSPTEKACLAFKAIPTTVDVRKVVVASNNTLWVCTSNKGVFIISPDRKTTQHIEQGSERNTLPDNFVHTAFEDQTGMFWIGTNSGTFIYNPAAQKFITHKNDPNKANSISHNSIRGFLEDDNQNLWICTQGGGLNRLNRKTGVYEHYLHDPNNQNSVKDNVLRTMAMGSDGSIWLGTTNKGISILNPRTKKITHYSHNPNKKGSLPNNNIWAFCLTQDQTMWVGTNGGGLAYFEPESSSFHTYTHDPSNKNSIGSNKILRILEDKSNILWIGTSGSGLDRFDRQKNTFEHFESNPLQKGSLSNKYVLSLCETRNGTIWVGTASGLNRFLPESNSFKSYKEADGLPNDMIYGILEDDQGNLWLSTNGGLVSFNPNSEKMNIYTEEDGLQSNEFNFGAYYQNKKGEMFFGGINGFNIFQPNQIKKNKYKPPIVITDFQIFNKSVSIDSTSFLKQHINLAKEVRLTYKESVIFFEFAALNFYNTSKNEYAYKLEGFDKDWNYIGTRRTATYTNIPAGDYTLKIKGSNNDKVWNDEGTLLKITITPPFWKEIWFLILLGLLVLLLLLLLYQSNINRIKERSTELEKLVSERTSEILEKNKEIITQKQEIESAYNNVELLNQIGYQITSSFSVEMILETSYDLMNQLMDASCFGIGLVNEEKGALEFPIFIENGNRLGYSYDIVDAENKLSGWCYTHQKPIFINNLETEYSKYLINKPAPAVGDLPLSVIYVPLSTPQRQLGVMTVQSFKQNVYNEYHLRLTEGLALYIVTALENAASYRLIEEQGEVLEKANNSIQSSIRYAKRIQNAILPHPQIIHSIVPEHFILYKPRDIVSGDFYWFATLEDKQFIAVVDCTGHGVPGGFMSMIGHQLLNEIIFRRGVTQPDLILKALDEGVKTTLQQERTASRDGMDISLCVIDHKANMMEFAGANNPMLYFLNDKMHFVRGTKSGIGGRMTKEEKHFKSHQIPLDKSVTYFLYSDGFQDQFGGAEGRKFLSKTFRQLLHVHHAKPMDEIKELLELKLEEWMGKKYKQIDDILIIGFRL